VMTFGFNTGALATMPAERRAHVYVECRYGADQASNYFGKGSALNPAAPVGRRDLLGFAKVKTLLIVRSQHPQRKPEVLKRCDLGKSISGFGKELKCIKYDDSTYTAEAQRPGRCLRCNIGVSGAR
jgi:hypothetical protein